MSTTHRQTLTADPEWLQEARDAVDGFVAGLHAGTDTADAETYNADFAEDVMWGSPFGATVIGYDTLHSIHRGMFDRGVSVAGASSRYQTVHVMAPTPDVAIAHVRRVAMDAGGQPIPIDDASVFSEMAMYVLVRREGNGGLPRARTLRFAQSRDRRVSFCPPLSDSVAEVRICTQRQLFATVGNAHTFPLGTPVTVYPSGSAASATRLAIAWRMLWQ